MSLSKTLNFKLDELVRKAVNESVQETFADLLVEDERTEQKHVSDQLKGMRAQTEVEDVEEADEEVSDEEKAVKVARKKKEVEIDVEEATPQVLSPKELQKITVEDFVSLLNRFRSGESLKRKDTRRQVTDYWENLTSAEKKAVYAYAQGLSQIVTSDVAGAKAADPSSYKIRTGDVKSKAQAKEMSPGKKSKELTDNKPAGEAIPIVVGEIADKRREQSRLKLLAGK